MPLGLGRDAQQNIVRHGTGDALEDSQTRNRRGGAAAKTGRHRNVALDLDDDRRRFAAQCAAPVGRTPVRRRSLR